MLSEAQVFLRCRECGKPFGHILAYVCDECFGALEASYNPGRLSVSRSVIEARPRSMWRYWEFLPLIDHSKKVDIGAGYTQLIKADRLARKLGISRL
ncbi:MAG: threonine synthase, partial [Nitrososphaerota archaeon]